MKKRNKFYSLCLCILILLLYLGCKTAPEPVVETTPKWLESTPENKNYYFAIGISGPTPRITDAWDQAIRRARAELGRVIISHISSQDTIINTSRGEYVSEIIKILSDTELNYTEVIERWYDRSGVYGPPDHYYVLARIEKSKAAHY